MWRAIEGGHSAIVTRLLALLVFVVFVVLVAFVAV
jgi:hypothetical protein